MFCDIATLIWHGADVGGSQKLQIVICFLFGRTTYVRGDEQLRLELPRGECGAI